MKDFYIEVRPGRIFTGREVESCNWNWTQGRYSNGEPHGYLQGGLHMQAWYCTNEDYRFLTPEQDPLVFESLEHTIRALEYWEPEDQ